VADSGTSQDESFTLRAAGAAAAGVERALAGSKGRSEPAQGLYRDPQLDAIIGRVHEVLLRAQVPFRCLDRCVPKEQLDLLQFSAGGPAELRGSPSAVMRRDARDSGSLSVWPEHLPDHLFGKRLALHLVGSIDRPEHVSRGHGGRAGPGINGHLHPDWHRHSPDAPVLSEEIHDAPTAIALLDVPHGKSRHLGPAQPAAE
jgi:hypothetical protein